MRRTTAVAATFLAALVAAPLLLAQPLPYQLIDRRQVDGSVMLVKRLPRGDPGPDPFTYGRTWDLAPATRYFRVRECRIPVKPWRATGDPPAVTYRDGKEVPNSVLNVFGGSSRRSFEKGEIVRLTDLNAAGRTVRMDLESVCLLGRRRKVRGRAVFVLSAHVGKKTLAEANRAVSACLEPASLRQAAKQCDPGTGEPPPVLRPGQTIEEVEGLLGAPAATRVEGRVTVYDYGPLLVHVESGKVVRLVIPALD